ncbi:hypothetical protein POSPLADRAFT_1040632, partial [Postia placenta MAD-698-R-SB12]
PHNVSASHLLRSPRLLPPHTLTERYAQHTASSRYSSGSLCTRPADRLTCACGQGHYSIFVHNLPPSSSLN